MVMPYMMSHYPFKFTGDDRNVTSDSVAGTCFIPWRKMIYGVWSRQPAHLLR